MPLTHTLLPEAGGAGHEHVGKRARSAPCGRPWMSLPMASVILDGEARKASVSRTSRK